MEKSTAPASVTSPPFTPARLSQIASEVSGAVGHRPAVGPTLLMTILKACNAALRDATTYDHAQTESWNNTIINTILQALIAESPTTPPNNAPAFKYAVNSTIIQHQTISTTTATATATAATTTDEGSSTASDALGGTRKKQHSERRGMHSAMGAYWNNERDGLWSYKYDGGEARGMDVVVSLFWIGL
ncbi:MAG: hypothetical protein M1838_003563 [Thelocarpon superellum]|nr:MAG: hypothetical protein M1838_003563 [Thelocarpon superellum]